MRVVEVAAGAVDDVMCRDRGRLVVAPADCAWTMGTGLSLGGLAYARGGCIVRPYVVTYDLRTTYVRLT